MKLKLTLYVFLLSLVTSLLAQDHAPTVEQCRADQRLWLSQLTGNSEIISGLSYHEISDRMGEMADCTAIDKDDSSRVILYAQTAVRFNTQQMIRLRDFVKRHGLFHPFIAEDAAGKR